MQGTQHTVSVARSNGGKNWFVTLSKREHWLKSDESRTFDVRPIDEIWQRNHKEDLKVCNDGTLVKILYFWTSSTLSKITVMLIFKNTTFRRLDSLSVFR
jgi:hypothetical protein